jgi:predicted HTH domain antitoxin
MLLTSGADYYGDEGRQIFKGLHAAVHTPSTAHVSTALATRYSYNREAIESPTMEITITIPEELTNQLHTDTQELERRVREKIAVELYQEGASEEQIRRLLNLDTRFEVHALLKRHGVPLRYTLQDLEDDRDTLHRLGL